jgi:hypothetical protein
VDELYVIARRVLLDALEALGEHRDATILVGAQAIYLHTGASELGVAEYTTDADLALDPALLAEIPPLEKALEGAGFYGSTGTIGIWKTRRRTSQALDIDVQVDLLVPATTRPGAGRRAARLTGHGVHAARKVNGLEGVLVDQAEQDIASLEPELDARVVRAKVAGPGALLVAKLFKIHERRGTPRANDVIPPPAAIPPPALLPPPSATLPPGPGFARAFPRGASLLISSHTHPSREQGSRDKPRAYGADLARRKPKLRLRLPGVMMRRIAERTPDAE